LTEQDNTHRATGRGTYEVWFLTFTDTATGAGYWIRSTYLAPRRGSGSAGVWFARFDPTGPTGTFGIHRASSSWSLFSQSFDTEIDGCVMRSGHAAGSLEGGGHSVRWDLEFGTGGPTYRLLPSVMYRGNLAPTKPLAPNVDTLVGGVITIDGVTSRVDDAPGQQGHLYGERHAERWAWAHCSDFEGEEAIVHALIAQGRRGPFKAPYLTSIGVRWRGEWIRLTKLSWKRDFGLGRWRVGVDTRHHRLTGRIEAPVRSMIRARYQDPDGSSRYCHNSEVASCRLALFERRIGGFEEVALLESRGTTHAEWAGRTPARAVGREFEEVP